MSIVCIKFVDFFAAFLCLRIFNTSQNATKADQKGIGNEAESQKISFFWGGGRDAGQILFNLFSIWSRKLNLFIFRLQYSLCQLKFS
jgi:hypothetical protein